MHIVPGQGRIAAVAVKPAPFLVEQNEAKELLLKHYARQLRPASLKVLEKVFSHPSVLRRRFAVDNALATLNETPDGRIARFNRWAVELSAQAVLDALAQVQAAKEEITGLVVNTCTGYLCPGLATYLIEKLDLARDLPVYDLVGSGCGGAIPNLQVCERLLGTAGQGLVVSVSVEISSAALQMGDDLSLLVSNALFADGAAAAMLWNRPQGLALSASASRYAPEFREDIRFVYKNGQLHNQLSAQLPEKVDKVVGALVTDLLASQNLQRTDIQHWILHAGGAKVLDAVKAQLGLDEDQVRVTRHILAEYGNMSSVTVWFVLKEMLNQGEIKPGDRCLMVSFGAGLSAHALLLQA